MAGIRTGAGDHDDRAVGFDVGVGAVSAAADDGFDLGRISFDRAVGIDFDAAAGEFVHEGAHGGLVLVAGDHDRLDVEPPVAEVVDGAHGVGIVGEAEVGAHFFLFDVAGVDADDDVDLVLEFLEQSDFRVGIKPRQDACRVEVADQLPAEFQIEFVVEFTGPFQDRLGLFLQIFLAVESEFHTKSFTADENCIYRSRIYRQNAIFSRRRSNFIGDADF